MIPWLHEYHKPMRFPTSRIAAGKHTSMQSFLRRVSRHDTPIWYIALDQPGRLRIDQYLAKVSFNRWPETVKKILDRDYSNDGPAK
jgi:hypothetical protein